MTHADLQEADQALRECIREHRKRCKLSQKELGDQVGLTESMIAAIEQGKRRVRPEYRLKFFDALQVPQAEHDQLLRRFLELPAFPHTGTYDPPMVFDEPELLPGSSAIAPSNGSAPISIPAQPAPEQYRRHWPTYLIVAVGAILLWNAAVWLWTMLAPPVVQSYVETLFPSSTPWRRCVDQPPDDPGIWVSGKSADSTCRFTDQGIVIMAGMSTFIDAREAHSWTAPILIYPMRGDFAARVKLEFDGGRYCCRHAGIGIRQKNDERTWLRITKDSRDNHVNSEGMINAKTTRVPVAIEDLPDVPSSLVSFDIVRQGSQVTLGYSLDGQQWVPYYQVQNFTTHQDLELFLMVYADAYTPPVSATSSELTITPLP